MPALQNHLHVEPDENPMLRTLLTLTALIAFAAPLQGQNVDALAGKRVAILGDSITQGGGYITFTEYYLNKLHPGKDFDICGLGLASETLPGLSEEGHAGGKFPRPCLFERLGRLLEAVKPEVVFACYGMNDGIYQPLDPERTAAFQTGVKKLIDQCKAAGVKEIFLVTPPIYDYSPKNGEFNYETVLAAYAEWETKLQIPNVHVIDLHTVMKEARAKRTEVFSKDKIHPGDEGHLLMARTILTALGVKVPEVDLSIIKADPMYKLVAERRSLRSNGWMKHIGYTREKVVEPQPLGTTEADAAKLQEKINGMRRAQ
jgi:lysophospholipase L1-like esterase